MFSDLPLGWKLFTLAMFLWIMGGVTWFAKKLAYEWIPVALVGYVAVAMVAFGLGYLLRER
ncbi:MAG: hypothetical protein KDG56_20280, partial [Ottowia sp.]|nr:hypothetical protein [Ottowia sp.]